MFDLGLCLRLGQKSLKNFVSILVKTRTPKGHFEINWPLEKSWNGYQKLALTFCLFLTYPELHFKTFFRSSDSNYFFNEGERFHEYCDYDKLLICTMAEITQFAQNYFVIKDWGMFEWISGFFFRLYMTKN